jgi:hypothetical protein
VTREDVVSAVGLPSVEILCVSAGTALTGCNLTSRNTWRWRVSAPGFM